MHEPVDPQPRSGHRRSEGPALQPGVLVPIRPDTLAAYENRAAINVLKTLDIPTFLPWGDSDPITAPSQQHLASIFKNATICEPVNNAGHFIQEDAGEEVAKRILEWMQ